MKKLEKLEQKLQEALDLTDVLESEKTEIEYDLKRAEAEIDYLKEQLDEFEKLKKYTFDVENLDDVQKVEELKRLYELPLSVLENLGK